MERSAQEQLQEQAMELQGYMQGVILIMDNYGHEARESRFAVDVLMKAAEEKAGVLNHALDSVNGEIIS